MKVGILADTHDNLTALREAVQILKRAEVVHVIHAGDYVAPFAIPPLDDLGVPVTGVLGNNDGERVGLTNQFKARGWVLEPKFAFPVVGTCRFAVHHEQEPIEPLATSGHYDVVVYGHTHRVDIRKVGAALVVNPGEVCGWVTGRRTCVVLDLETLEASLEPLKG